MSSFSEGHLHFNRCGKLIISREIWGINQPGSGGPQEALDFPRAPEMKSSTGVFLSFPANKASPRLQNHLNHCLQRQEHGCPFTPCCISHSHSAPTSVPPSLHNPTQCLPSQFHHTLTTTFNVVLYSVLNSRSNQSL